MSEKTMSDLEQLTEPGAESRASTEQRPDAEDVSPFRHPEPEHVYKVIELVGSSKKSVEEAVERAIEKASATIRHLRWFEVIQTRGHIENGKVAHFQVTLKAGFKLED
jgi:flavin-binding protein dodecin